MPRQFQLRREVGLRFMDHIDNNRGDTLKDVFAWQCVKAGIDKISETGDDMRLAPIMHSSFDAENVRVMFTEDQNLDTMVDRLPTRVGITSRRQMLIEGCLRYMRINNLIVVRSGVMSISVSR